MCVACGGDDGDDGGPGGVMAVVPAMDAGVAPDPDADMMEGGPARLALSVEHVFGDAALALGTANVTASGLPVQISGLRYWLSNVVLIDAQGGQHAVPAAYYLIEQTAANLRTTVTIEDVPAATYTALQFSVGVDADHNHSLDVFEGELSTEVDMHWSWNSGFIFLKLEGTLGQPGNKGPFLAHVGSDPLFQTQIAQLGALELAGGETGSVQLRVDLASIFNTIDVFQNTRIVGGPAGSPADVVLSRFMAGISVPRAPPAR
jgi:hypothetical protein